MLKYVKLLFLNYKRINLPVGNKMNKAFFILLLFCCFFAACTKTSVGSLAAQNAQAAIDLKIITDYLAQNPSLKATPVDSAGFNTGVYYIIKQQGSGTALFTNSTQITVADTGRLLYDGKSYTDQLFTQTNDFHPSYILSQVIRGWQLGIPQCKKGGIIRLLIPSRYAYGPNPQPNLGNALGLTNGLPANAVLDFDIQLYDIVN
ncbi:MAG: peptidylprolyl isomerase [Mucilaginibacter sp.]|nr:peptidylprolyl isomerase [Mucilaginibacter sp.]MDB5109271.1 peptidylprolyl isomerase [Mucilaginibacter sp.]